CSGRSPRVVRTEPDPQGEHAATPTLLGMTEPDGRTTDPGGPPTASAAPAAPPRSRWAARWRSLRGAGGLRILGAAGGGLLLNLAFAPRTWWWAALLGLALLGLSVHRRRLLPAL